MAARYVTTGQVAQALGVSDSTVQGWAKDGRIQPAYRTPGGHMRWVLDDVRRALGVPIEEAEPVQDSSTPERQPVAAAIVTSPLGVLAGRRNDGKPPWTFIAGEVGPGESIRDAAVREVKEETGLLVTAAEREIGRRVHPKTGRTMIYLACTPTEGLDVFVGDTEELAEVRWLSLPEVDELMVGVFEPVRSHLGETIA